MQHLEAHKTIHVFSFIQKHHLRNYTAVYLMVHCRTEIS